MSDIRILQRTFSKALAPKKAFVKRRAAGFITHDYLVPGGPYQEQWDWDGFFIGMALASEIPSEAIYLKNWCLNYLEHVHRDGFTPGLLTPRGTDKRLKHIKPFLAQGCYFASIFLADFSWIHPFWQKLIASLAYREHHYFDSKRNLAAWYDSMESGADNNIAVLSYPTGSVLATDLNSFLYREYLAMKYIATRLKKPRASIHFEKKARAMRSAILTHLWNKNDAIFYNKDRKTGNFIRHLSYSSLIPLWAGIAPRRSGREMIKRHILNPNEYRAPYGIRTLAQDDSAYNQKNIIKPHSNWQGPAWPLVNYLSMHALLNYGFKKEALHLAITTVKMCLRDIEQTGGMHENYDAETGKSLAAPNFISWNLLAGNMIHETTTRMNPFRLEISSG